MNDIENKISYEERKIASLNKKKNELLYDIPDFLNAEMKSNILKAAGITVGLTLSLTIFGGWFLMDYGKVLLPSFLGSSLLSGIGAFANYFFKTGIERRKLKKGDIPKINHDILESEDILKKLKKELIISQSRVINEQINNQTRNIRIKQVVYPQNDSYNQGRSR